MAIIISPEERPHGILEEKDQKSRYRSQPAADTLPEPFDRRARVSPARRQHPGPPPDSGRLARVARGGHRGPPLGFESVSGAIAHLHPAGAHRLERHG